ncbi:MAG: hypothetical protein PHG35_01545 [Dehalococcoidales bacterium]|nr:hypothetical protein [Dehalococcoidales bacterium]
MAENTTLWKETCERYIAFLDIMGFKNLVLTNEHEKIKGKLDSLYSIIKRIENDFHHPKISKIPDLNIDTGNSIIKPVIFSDSIILISNDDSIVSANSIIISICRIFSKAIKFVLPIKGAVAHGKFSASANEPIYFGKPLIDAFELQRELSFYGVVLHHTMEKKLREIDSGYFSNMELISKYPTPTKSGIINHYCVNWAYLFSDEFIIELSNRLYDDVSGKPRLYVDNTLEFAKKMNKRKDNLNIP